MSHNDITGDRIATKGVSDAYRSNFDAIFGKKKVEVPAASTTPPLCGNINHVWASTCQLPPGPAKCMYCGIGWKDVPAAQLGRASVVAQPHVLRDVEHTRQVLARDALEG